MSPLVTEDDVKAVSEQMRSMWIGRGERVAELEQVMAGWVDAKYAVALGSGTAALVVALRSIPCEGVSYPRYPAGCVALEVAVKMAGKRRGHDASIAVYPSESSNDIVDYARCLPRWQETKLRARFGVFSFGALKDVSGGIGGCVVSNEPIEADEYRRLSPISDINAAMILTQLHRYKGKSAREVAGGVRWVYA